MDEFTCKVTRETCFVPRKTCGWFVYLLSFLLLCLSCLFIFIFRAYSATLSARDGGITK